MALVPTSPVFLVVLPSARYRTVTVTTNAATVLPSTVPLAPHHATAAGGTGQLGVVA